MQFIKNIWEAIEKLQDQQADFIYEDDIKICDHCGCLVDRNMLIDNMIDFDLEEEYFNEEYICRACYLSNKESDLEKLANQYSVSPKFIEDMMDAQTKQAETQTMITKTTKDITPEIEQIFEEAYDRGYEDALNDFRTFIRPKSLMKGNATAKLVTKFKKDWKSNR